VTKEEVIRHELVAVILVYVNYNYYLATLTTSVIAMLIYIVYSTIKYHKTRSCLHTFNSKIV